MPRLKMRKWEKKEGAAQRAWRMEQSELVNVEGTRGRVRVPGVSPAVGRGATILIDKKEFYRF